MFETPTLDTLAAYNLNVALPAIVLLVGAMVLLLVDLFLPEERRVVWTPALALVAVTISAILTLGNYTPTNPNTADSRRFISKRRRVCERICRAVCGQMAKRTFCSQFAPVLSRASHTPVSAVSNSSA